MHTNENRKLVSSKAVGLAARVGGEKNYRMAAGFAPVRRAIPLTSHRYQQTAAAKSVTGQFLPAAGNRWNGDLNNVGSNGNYWSSTLNGSNPNNAYNLNFNSGNANWNNNRNNGQSVRPVR